MHITLKATNIELTEAVEEYVRKRAAGLEKNLPAEQAANARLSAEVGKTTAHHKSGEVFRAEFNLVLAGKPWRAVSEKADLYSAIDEAKEELLRIVRSQKDKKVSLLRRGGERVKKIVRGLSGRAR